MMIEDFALGLLTEDQKKRIRDKLAARVEKEIDKIDVSQLIDVESLGESVVEDLYDNGAGEIGDLIRKWLVKKVKSELGVK